MIQASSGGRRPLVVAGAAQDVPRLLSYWKRGKEYDIALRLRPDGRSAFVVASGDQVWAWTHPHGGAPPAPEREVTTAEAQTALIEARDPGPVAPVHHKGKWSGHLEVLNDIVTIYLTRKVGIILTTITGVAGAWNVAVRREERWWSPAGEGKAPKRFVHLDDACRHAMVLATDLTSAVCAVRELEVRGTHDAAYAARQRERDAAKPAPKRAPKEDAVVAAPARLSVPKRLDVPGFQGFPDAQRRLPQVVSFLQGTGFGDAAKLLKALGWTLEQQELRPGGASTTLSLGEVLRRTEKALRSAVKGRKGAGRLDAYNAAVGALGSLAGGTLLPPLALEVAPDCLTTIHHAAEGAELEGAALLAELQARWARQGDPEVWSDARVKLMTRTKQLIERAWALVRSPRCTGAAKEAATVELRKAMDGWERLAAAVCAQGRGLLSARVRTGAARHGGQRVVEATVLEGPHAKEKIVVTIPPTFAGWIVPPGSVLFAHYDPASKPLQGEVSTLRLDTIVAADAIPYGDAVASIRYLAERAALAAARAASACAGGGKTRKKAPMGGTSSTCPTPTTPSGGLPGEERASVPPTFYRCQRCGLHTLTRGRHLAFGAIPCPGTEAEQVVSALPARDTMRDIVAANSRFLVPAGLDTAPPVRLKDAPTVAELDALPVGSVVAAFSPDSNQWPAMVMRVVKRPALWREYALSGGTLGKNGADTGRVAEAMARGAGQGWDAYYVLVRGTGKVDLDGAMPRVAAAVSSVPEWERASATTTDHLRKRHEHAVAMESRLALHGVPYAKWGADAWAWVASEVKRKATWNPTAATRSGTRTAGFTDRSGPTPAVEYGVEHLTGAPYWTAWWMAPGQLDKTVVPGNHDTRELAVAELARVLGAGGVAPSSRAASAPAPAASPSSRSDAPAAARRASRPPAGDASSGASSPARADEDEGAPRNGTHSRALASTGQWYAKVGNLTNALDAAHPPGTAVEVEERTYRDGARTGRRTWTYTTSAPAVASKRPLPTPSSKRPLPTPSSKRPLPTPSPKPPAPSPSAEADARIGAAVDGALERLAAKLLAANTAAA